MTDDQTPINGLAGPRIQLSHVRFIRKDHSFVMRLIGVFSPRFMTDFWTTWRWPFGQPTIYYPNDNRGKIINPARYPEILEHEGVHVKQQEPWFGPWVTLALAAFFPLPIIWSGRWFIERPAYLNDIRRGRLSVEQAIDILWNSYGWCWPRPLMRVWFTKELSKIPAQFHQAPPQSRRPTTKIPPE